MKSFPPVKSVFLDAWVLFKKSALSLFFLSLFTLALYVLFFIVGGVGALMIAGGSGVFKMLSGGAPDLQSFLSVPFLTFLGVYGVAFVILSTVIGIAIKAAMILFIAEAERSEPFGAVVKRGFGFVGAIFLVEFLVFLLNVGAFFFFFIPLILFAILLSFVTYEVVLNNKRGAEALRSSVQIVSQNFIDILVRSVLFFLMYLALAFLLPSLLRRIDPDAGALVGGLSFVVNTFLGWYSLAFSISLYKQARECTDVEKKSNIAWMVIVSVLGWVILALILIGVGRLVMSPAFQKNVQQYLEQRMTEPTNKGTGQALTQVQADNLAYATFLAANAYRQQKGYTALEEDGTLCAYAQRRLEQLETFGRYDDRKGFYEDINNAEVVDAYFPDYVAANEGVWSNPDTASDPEVIVSKWTTGSFGEAESSILANPDYSNVCFRATPNWLVLIGATKKE